MTRLNRYVPSLFALACMACAAGRTAAPAWPQWPPAEEQVRWEPVPGISIVAPRLPPGSAEATTESTRVRCGPVPAPGWITLPYSLPSLNCSWEHLNFSRQFQLDWYPNTFEAGKSPEENLARLERERVQPFARDEYTRLPAPWMGWEWRGPGEGELIRDRWIVVGTGLLFLQAIAVEEDPFPEGEAFLDSLRVTDVK